MIKILFQNISKNDKFCLFLVFASFFSIFSLIQFSSSNLSGVDAYYHIRYAYLYRTMGIEETINNFSLAGEYSILNQYPTDLSFFYHILLMPLTYGNLIVGSKFAAIIFASLIFALFYWVLQKFKVKYGFLWVLLLFAASSEFIFRLTLSRPFVLSISILILGFYLIIRKKYIWLLVLSFFYALTYSISPLILVISSFYILSEYIQTKKIDWKLLLYPAAGIILGLVVRPDFPQNLYLIFSQSFDVLFIKLRGISLSIGAELYPISAPLGTNSILIFLFSLGLAFMILDPAFGRNKKDELSIIRLYSFFLATFFCLLTLMVHRFFEYWTPFVLFFVIFTFKHISSDKYWRNIGYQLKKVLREFTSFSLARIKFIFFFLVFLIAVLGISINAFKEAGAIENSGSFDRYQGASQWLKENTLPKSIVFNASWDNFPQLFFYNHQNYYIIGKEPTFMYLYNKELYWLWKNITDQGIICDQETKKCPGLAYAEKTSQRQEKIHQLIKNRFQSQYIFIDNPEPNPERFSRHHFLIKALENSSLFKRVYQDEKYPEVMIFQLN